MRWTVITNCDSFFITKCDTVYYKLRQVLQSATDLLQIATGITKCDDYYKLRQYKGGGGEGGWEGCSQVVSSRFSTKLSNQLLLEYYGLKICVSQRPSEKNPAIGN